MNTMNNTTRYLYHVTQHDSSSRVGSHAFKLSFGKFPYLTSEAHGLNSLRKTSFYRDGPPPHSRRQLQLHHQRQQLHLTSPQHHSNDHAHEHYGKHSNQTTQTEKLGWIHITRNMTASSITTFSMSLTTISTKN